MKIEIEKNEVNGWLGYMLIYWFSTLIFLLITFGIYKAKITCG